MLACYRLLSECAPSRVELHITAYERDSCHKITLARSLVIAAAMLSLVVALVSGEVVVAGAG